jgi:PiT family inorganic phosphate transporter
VAARARWISNTKQSVNSLLTVPLIFAAALLSFAHGSNDVANAVGPLAAIVDIVSQGGAKIGTPAAIPTWVMMVGALGIALGLALYGPNRPLKNVARMARCKAHGAQRPQPIK